MHNFKKIIPFALITVNTIFACETNIDKFFIKTDLWSEPKELNIDSEILNSFVINKSNHESCEIKNIVLETDDGVKVPVVFFDRKSDVALILGQALPASKESMLIYAKLFSNYDVILFDYRWANHYTTSLLKSLITFSPIKQMLLDEEKEVRAVINYFKKHKEYKKFVGLSECYSNFLFIKIQADDCREFGIGPFTHLVSDSCWYSMKSFLERICYDPFLPFNAQNGGAPTIIKKLTNSLLAKYLVMKIMFSFFNNISVDKYLLNINIPILFIHGTNDLYVPIEHFEKIWKSTISENKIALLTPYRHSDNLGNKPLYSFVCEKFIENKSIKKCLKMFFS